MSLVLNVPSSEKQILGRPGRLICSREIITLETTGGNPSKGEEINMRGHKKADSETGRLCRVLSAYLTRGNTTSRLWEKVDEDNVEMAIRNLNPPVSFLETEWLWLASAQCLEDAPFWRPLWANGPPYWARAPDYFLSDSSEQPGN